MSSISEAPPTAADTTPCMSEAERQLKCFDLSRFCFCFGLWIFDPPGVKYVESGHGQTVCDGGSY